MPSLIIGMQIGFTIVSLVLVIYNPDMHCGCFGELIHLTHWQTLIKNVFLLVLLYLAFIRYYCIYNPTGDKQKRAFYISIVLTILLSAYSWFNLPIIDFTAYKPGTKLVSRQNLPMLKMEWSDLYPDFSSGCWDIISMYDLSMGMPELMKIADYFMLNEGTGHNVILVFSATEEKVNALYEDLRTDSGIADEVLDKMRRSSFFTDTIRGGTLKIGDQYIFLGKVIGLLLVLIILICTPN